MDLNARASALVSRLARGRRSLSSQDLAINFSFVLHESSESAAVDRAVEASQRHRRARFRPRETILDGGRDLTVEGWISTSIGLPEDLRGALRETGLPDSGITFIDRRDVPLQPAVFFRGQASLCLPAGINTVGVAALIARPGGASQQLIVRGPFHGKAQYKAALRALEEIIQAHAEQWMPKSRLWVVPAEVIFRDEFV